MKANGKLILIVAIFTIGFIGGIIAEHFRTERYEFHVGTGAAVGYIWRLDHHSGKVDISFGSHGWHTIPEAWTPPSLDSKLTMTNNITNAPVIK